MLYESFQIKGKNIIDEICMRTASGTLFRENLDLQCQFLKSLVFNRFTHWNTSKIMYLSHEPSVNDPGQNLDRSFFVISDKFFAQNEKQGSYLSTCLFHRFEVWDLQSKLK